MKNAIALMTVFFAQTGWTESVPEAIARIEAELNALKHDVANPGKFLLHDEVSDESTKLEGGDLGLVANGVDRAALQLQSHRGDLKFRSAQGQVLLRAGEITDGVPSIYMWNQSGKLIAFFGGWGNKKRGGLFVTDDEATRGVELDGDGRVRVRGANIHDYAEIFNLAEREGIYPGCVVAYDPSENGLVPASRGNARQVIGVISGAGGLRPGMIIGSREDGTEDLPVSLSGVTFVRVTNEAGNIQPGDLLVASSTPGAGMRAPTKSFAQGEIFGKALESHEGDGEGLVLMLVLNG